MGTEGLVVQGHLCLWTKLSLSHQFTVVKAGGSGAGLLG